MWESDGAGAVTLTRILAPGSVDWPGHFGEAAREILRSIRVVVLEWQSCDDCMVLGIMFRLAYVYSECADSTGMKAVHSERLIEGCG